MKMVTYLQILKYKMSDKGIYKALGTGFSIEKFNEQGFQRRIGVLEK